MHAWAVSSLWRFPWGCPRRALPGTVPSWSPDFPRRKAPRSSGHPRNPADKPLRATGQAGASAQIQTRAASSASLGKIATSLGIKGAKTFIAPVIQAMSLTTATRSKLRQ